MQLLIRHFRGLLLVAAILPVFGLGIDLVTGRLGGNPIEALHIRLGDWALRFLWLTLAVTPLQTVTKWRGMADYRQLFGLCAFFYASLHLLAYLWLDHVWIWRAIISDVAESSYIWLGLIAYLIILALALTSSKPAKKCLGKNWKKLHRLIYMASAAAILHYFWQLKGNLAEPLFYLFIVVLLMAFRVVTWLKAKTA